MEAPTNIMKNVSIKDITLRKTIVDALSEINEAISSTRDSAYALFDCDGEGLFDIPDAGKVLLTCEGMIFSLRAIMFTVVNNDLGASLEADIITMVDDVVELRNMVADSLDDILGDTDAIIEDSLSDLASAFTVYVPSDAEVRIDGEPIDLSDYADEEENGEVPLDLLPNEELVVNGSCVDISACEPGEEYDLCGPDEADGVGNGMPDDSFTLWVPAGANILWDGEPWTPNEEDFEEELGLVVGSDTELSIDGDYIDLSDCEPGEEYRLDCGIVVPLESFLIRVPFGSTIELCGQTLETDDSDNDGGYINLMLTPDAVLTVEGTLVDLSGCEPEGEYELSIEDNG